MNKKSDNGHYRLEETQNQQIEAMDTDLQDNVVDMVRAIRNRRYEETKHMTQEEKMAHDRQRMEKSVAAFKERTANLKPDYERFPFLAKKDNP